MNINCYSAAFFLTNSIIDYGVLVKASVIRYIIKIFIVRIAVKKVGIPNPCNIVLDVLKRKLKAFLHNCQKTGNPEIWTLDN